MFLGVAFTCGAEEQVIGFFDVGLPAEYELMRSIRVVAGTERKRVGVVATMANLFGGTNFQRNQFTPQWSVVTELRKQYDVVEISPEMAIGQDVDALLVPLPSSLQTDEQGFVADYIRSGKPALILVDPLPAVNPTLSPSEWVGDGNPFTYPPGQPRPGPRGNVREWIRNLGVDWEPTRIVWDAYNPHPELAHMPEDVVFLGAGNENPATFDAGDPMTARLQELVLLFPGSLQAVDDPRFEFQPLLRSGMVSGANGYFSLVRGTPFGPQVNPSPPRRQDDDDYIVAARIRSVGGEAEDDAGDAGAGAPDDAGAEAEQAPAGEAAAEPESATDAAESPEVATGGPGDEAPEPESGAEAPPESDEAAEGVSEVEPGTPEAAAEAPAPEAAAEEIPEGTEAPAVEAEADGPRETEPDEAAAATGGAGADEAESEPAASAEAAAEASTAATAESFAGQTAEFSASQTAESTASAESPEPDPEPVEAPAEAQGPGPESVETPAEAQARAVAESPAPESEEEQTAEPAGAADTVELEEEQTAGLAGAADTAARAGAAELTDPGAESEQAAAAEPEAIDTESETADTEPAATDIEPEADVGAEGAPEPEAAGDIDIIVVADLDFISEQFFQIREQAPGGLNFDNITFFLNAMDTLLGEDAFIDLRSRRARHRTLERVEAQTAEFIEQRTADEQQAEADAEEALTEAQQRLNDRVAELQARNDIDAQTRQIMVRNLEEVENRRLEVLSANIETEKDTRIQASRENMEAQIRRIQTSIKTFAILLPPVPVVLLGIAIFVRRRRREREGAAAAHRLRE